MRTKVPVSQTINYELVRKICQNSAKEISSSRHNRTFLSIRCNETLKSNQYPQITNPKSKIREKLETRPKISTINDFTKQWIKKRIKSQSYWIKKESKFRWNLSHLMQICRGKRGILETQRNLCDVSNLHIPDLSINIETRQLLRDGD